MANQVVHMIFPFVLRSLLLIKMGDQFLGMGSLFMSLLSMLSFFEAAFSMTISYYMYEPVAQQNSKSISAFLKTFRNIYIGIGVVILIGGLCMLPILECMSKDGFPDKVNVHIVFLLYLANTLVGYFTCLYKTVLFRAAQRVDILMKIFLVTDLSMYIGQTCVIYFFQNYYYYVLCIIFSSIIANIMLYYFTKRYFPQIKCYGELSKDIKLKIREKVLILIGQQLDVTILNSSDTVIISLILGVSCVAIYSNYFLIISALIGCIDVAIFQATIASVGNSVVVESRQYNYEQFKKIGKFSAVVQCICGIGLTVMLQNVVTLCFGNEMLLKDYTVYIWLLYFFISIQRKNVLMYKNALGLWERDKWRPVVAIIVNICLDLILVPSQGISGVLLATVLCMAVIELPWETYVLYKDYFRKDIRLYYRDTIPQMIMNLIVIVISSSFFYKIPGNSIKQFILKSVYCIVYLAGIIFVIGLKGKKARSNHESGN